MKNGASSRSENMAGRNSLMQRDLVKVEFAQDLSRRLVVERTGVAEMNDGLPLGAQQLAFKMAELGKKRFFPPRRGDAMLLAEHNFLLERTAQARDDGRRGAAFLLDLGKAGQGGFRRLPPSQFLLRFARSLGRPDTQGADNQRQGKALEHERGNEDREGQEKDQ